MGQTRLAASRRRSAVLPGWNEVATHRRPAVVDGAGDGHADGPGEGNTPGRLFFRPLHRNHEVIEFGSHFGRHPIRGGHIGLCPVKRSPEKGAAGTARQAWIIFHKPHRHNCNIYQIVFNTTSAHASWIDRSVSADRASTANTREKQVESLGGSSFRQGFRQRHFRPALHYIQAGETRLAKTKKAAPAGAASFKKDSGTIRTVRTRRPWRPRRQIRPCRW